MLEALEWPKFPTFYSIFCEFAEAISKIGGLRHRESLELEGQARLKTSAHQAFLLYTENMLEQVMSP